MKKRMTVLLILAVLIVLSAAGALLHKEDTPEYTVGICQFTQHDSLDAASLGFKDALTKRLDGRVTFIEQNAGGDLAVCATAVNDLISKDVDLILANSTNALQTAASATAKIPVLGTSVTDYAEALQLEQFDGTVGGNVSGYSDLVPPDVLADMIRELFPDAKQLGMLYCSAEPNSRYQAEALEAALEQMGYSCQAYRFIDSGDLSAAAMTAVSECDILYIPTDNTAASNAELIANICLPEQVPVITGDESTCQVCGAVTLSVNYYDLGYATGEMAADILTGEKDISEIPIAYAQSFTKKYNASVCQALGIDVPEDYEELPSK